MIDVVRRSRIIRLLQTRDDHLPQPTRRDDSLGGFVHRVTVRETCPDCLANDCNMPGCETCDGRGYVETFRERDPYATDHIPKAGTDTVKLGHQPERDREIDRLDDQIAQPKSDEDLLEDANLRGYVWEEARARMYDQFDYQALDHALDVLRVADEGASHALHAVYVYGWIEPSASFEAAVERGLRFVDRLMPDPIRAPGSDVAPPEVAKESVWRGRTSRHAEARARREDRILHAHFRWGWTAEQIADHESLSARRVRQILSERRGRSRDVAAVASGPAA